MKYKHFLEELLNLKYNDDTDITVSDLRTIFYKQESKLDTEIFDSPENLVNRTLCKFDDDGYVNDEMKVIKFKNGLFVIKSENYDYDSFIDVISIDEVIKDWYVLDRDYYPCFISIRSFG